MRILSVALAILLGLALLLHPRSDTGPRAVPRREREASIVLRGRDGAKPRVVVGGLYAGPNGEASEAAAVLAATFLADVRFEGVFDLLPAELPGAALPARAGDPALEKWQGTGADGLLVTALREEGAELLVEARLYELVGGQLAFARAVRGPTSHVRAVAHVLAHELLEQQAGLRSVAMTRLAFVSDRAGSRREPTGYMRRVKEIYISDYDGAAQRRVTTDGDLVLTPAWSPDGSTIAYTAFRSGFQQILIVRPDDARPRPAAAGYGKNWLPAWSPDGQRLAFTANRDGNAEIYVMRADGSEPARLTRNWHIDTSPAWSPDGRQIAFTSDRTGSPQIWIMDADGGNQRALTTERYCDRPTWSPSPFNEIAYVSRTKTGFDIKVIDVGTGVSRQLTFGEGFNESPAWAPSGRHLAFCSSRSGTQQIWTMTRLGEDLRQVTRVGANSMPAWSR